MIKTRRTLTKVALVVGILVLPVELVVLDLIAGNHRSPAAIWAARLSPAASQEAALQIESYPLEYRRALLSVLPAEGQAAVWRRVITRFLDEHPSATVEQRALLNKVAALEVAETFVKRDAATLAELRKLSGSVVRMFGPEVARALLVTAGPLPKDESVLVATLPLRARFERFVWQRLTVGAFAPECNCYHQNWVNCSGSLPRCSENQSCEFSYFGCGTISLEPCDGYCMPPLP